MKPELQLKRCETCAKIWGERYRFSPCILSEEKRVLHPDFINGLTSKISCSEWE